MVYCDECKNFPEPDSSLWKPPNAEHFKCLLKIPMLFKMPQSASDDDWGFWKKECLFFSKKEYKMPLAVNRYDRYPKLRLIEKPAE